MNNAESVLKSIKEAIFAGRTVYISTMTRVTAISPENYKRWEKSGLNLFKISKDGNLMIAQGKHYGRITSGDMLLVGITFS